MIHNRNPSILDPKTDREGRIVVGIDSIAPGVAATLGGLIFAGISVALLNEELRHTPWTKDADIWWQWVIPCAFLAAALLGTLLGVRAMFMKTLVTIDRRRGTVTWNCTRLFRSESWEFPLADIWLVRHQWSLRGGRRFQHALWLLSVGGDSLRLAVTSDGPRMDRYVGDLQDKAGLAVEDARQGPPPHSSTFQPRNPNRVRRRQVLAILALLFWGVFCLAIGGINLFELFGIAKIRMEIARVGVVADATIVDPLTYGSRRGPIARYEFHVKGYRNPRLGSYPEELRQLLRRFPDSMKDEQTRELEDLESLVYGEDFVSVFGSGVARGAKVKVTYDPRNPERSLGGDRRGANLLNLMAGMRFTALFSILFTSFGLMVILSFGLSGFRRWADSRVARHAPTGGAAG